MKRLFCAMALLATAARSEEAPLTFIGTSELSAKVSSGPASRWNFTVVDARTRVEYEESHIAGAINVPASQTQALLPKRVKDRSRTIIFYCNGPKCTKSQKGARAAIALGYSSVFEYNEGLPAWGKAGLRLAGTPLPAFEPVARSVVVPAAAAAAITSCVWMATSRRSATAAFASKAPPRDCSTSVPSADIANRAKTPRASTSPSTDPR